MKSGKISGRNPIHAPADGSSLATDLAIEKATIPHVIKNVATKYQKNRVEKLIIFLLVVRPADAQAIQNIGKLGRCLVNPRFGGEVDFRQCVLAFVNERIDDLLRRLIVSHKD
jgi:hypothetical protein